MRMIIDVIVFVLIVILYEINGKKPHIIFVLVDDWGWDDVGYHRKRFEGSSMPNEIRTPNIDNLVKNGIELNRHYTYNFCSATRASLQTGRLPVHVSTKDYDPLCVNPDDPVSGFAGIPRNMTGIAEQLKNVGYKTHMTGKWDVGMATWEHTPMGRGYDTFFGFYHHGNDYWDETLHDPGTGSHRDICIREGWIMTDLWSTDGPAKGKNGTKWEDFMLTENSIDVIMNHDTTLEDNPLFLFHSTHVPHTPLQIPDEFGERFAFVEDVYRRNYSAMIEYLDSSIGELVTALQTKDMWDNTLLIMSSDNGGAIYGTIRGVPGMPAINAGATNHPLRGGKFSDWEGGIRVNAFVSGGFLPSSVRNTVVDDYIHVADWYATLSHVAGITDLRDKAAERANLPPIDSMNQWPVIIGSANKKIRREIHISKMTLIQDEYKLVTGADEVIVPLEDPERMSFDCYGQGWGELAVTCSKPGRDCGKGCLFNIRSDPNEAEQIMNQPERVASMLARLHELNQNNFNPNRGEPSFLGCKIARDHYGGFYGPFVNIAEPNVKKDFAEIEIPECEEMLEVRA